MHSSRMCTARALTVSPSMLCAGGGGVCSGGVCSWGDHLLQGAVCSRGEGSAPGGRGVSALGGMSAPGGGIPACTEADPPC